MDKRRAHSGKQSHLMPSLMDVLLRAEKARAKRKTSTNKIHMEPNMIISEDLSTNAVVYL